MDIITSRNSRSVIEAIKLKQKKYRDDCSLFFFEGRKLLADAARAGVVFKKIFYTEKNAAFIQSFDIKCEKTPVSESVYEKLSDESSPSGVFCIALHLDNIKNSGKIIKEENPVRRSAFTAVSVRDPGNLGTLIRTANAFGVGTLILSSDCADVYNPKTVRSSMGALFRQDILIWERDICALPAFLSSNGFRTYAAALHKDSVSLDRMETISDVCFAVGNEGHGLSDSFIEKCDGTVFIPMEEDSESLNVSGAAAVLMWESYKSRR